MTSVSLNSRINSICFCSRELCYSLFELVLFTSSRIKQNKNLSIYVLYIQIISTNEREKTKNNIKQKL